MELRVLRYFLAVAREESISGAAEAEHVTPPTLSRQMMDLEDELGKVLFLRGKRRITLTEEGLFLRKRAQEIVALVEKTQSEFSVAEKEISGDVWIGGGETEAMRLVARAAHKLQAAHPHISYHLFSGNAEDLAERLDKGLVDFGIFIEPADLSKYDFIKLPMTDIWGVLMRKDSPLAARATIRAGDLTGLPLLCSSQPLVRNELAGWMGEKYEQLNSMTTYNLLYNASLMVEEGLGYALCIDRIVKSFLRQPFVLQAVGAPAGGGHDHCVEKVSDFSKAAAKFLEQVQKELAG